MFSVSRVHSVSIKFRSGCWYSRGSPADKRCEENALYCDGRQRDMCAWFHRPALRTVLRCRRAAALREPRVPLEKMKSSKGFRSLEIMFQPRGSGACKQVRSQNSLLRPVVALCAGL